ncbi:apolipoprotein N-acyltransferase [Microlunatus aurantiacus]|uniref:apolipoprotein N-acyltransferase n=1 Tax=Microlunatus aurantiacus TaxID=446786 RepID=UPI0031D04891
MGYLFGVAFLAVTISWVHVLGVWVAALLVLVEALFFAGLGAALSLVTRLRGWPVLAACCWVGVEYAYSRVPFGGFGWTRIAYAAVDTPLAGFLPLVGVAGVSFLVALAGQLVAWLVLTLRHRGLTTAVGIRRLAVVAAVLVLLVGAGAGLRQWQTDPQPEAAGELQVGVVQGNVPGRGIEALGRARTVTTNHLAETVALMTRARLGLVPVPDFVLWPENSTDIDPYRDPVTRQTVQNAAEVAGVPIMVGAVTQGPGAGERQITALWWDPDRGETARYHKQNLVPFGEWIPLRKQLLPLLPILSKVGAQSVPGTEPGVLPVQAGGRDVVVGDVMCFELAYDRTVYGTLRAGAEVLVVQSNNATYGGTGQIEQQFAITRARAMEARREIAVATTNSVSGVIDRSGRVVQRTNEFTAASLVTALPLRSSLTPAVLVAPWLDRGLAVAGLLACLLTLRQPRHRHSAPSEVR